MKKLNAILLVDDNEDDNFIHKRIILKSEIVPGDEYIFVKENGEEALEFLTNAQNKTKYGERFPPILMFLDINMPCMDGFELLDELQKRKDEFELIIIMMLTTSVNNIDKERAAQFTDVMDYIEKPLTKEMIEKIYRHYFGS